MKKLIYFLVITIITCSCDKDEKKTTGSIYGIVSDKSTGELIPDVNVSLTPGGKSTITGTDGSYNFIDIKSGIYTIHITKENYNSEKKETEVIGSKKTEGHFQIERIPTTLTIDKDTLDFGKSADVNTLSFSIVNRGYQTLDWSIEQNCSWVKNINPTSGTLKHSITATVTIVIDRNKLSQGNNQTVIIAKSSNGKAEITLKAIGENKSMPTLNTLPVTDVQSFSAIFNGEITATGLTPYTERGFVYSTFSMPTIENTLTKLTAPVTEEAKYSANATGLLLDQTYYVRAYAINKSGIVFSSNEERFKTVLTLDYITLQSDGIMVHRYDISSGLDWHSANNLCNSSKIGEYSNWRLPTQGELETLYDKRVIIGNFTTTREGARYWSSTSVPSGYIHVNFHNGYNHIGYNSDSYRVRCIRTLP